MNTIAAHSTKPAAISPPSTTVVNGKIAKRELARLPGKLYRQLYAEVDRVKRLPKDNQLIAGAELLVIVFELSDELGAISLAIKGVLELES